ncbi:MAG: hypothetical protein K8Q99_00795 [Acholeplasmataceae bacterium]|nr:hypothetical protein [Acholeplasmataceae bacterium]
MKKDKELSQKESVDEVTEIKAEDNLEPEQEQSAEVVKVSKKELKKQEAAQKAKDKEELKKAKTEQEEKEKAELKKQKADNKSKSKEDRKKDKIEAKKNKKLKKAEKKELADIEKREKNRPKWTKKYFSKFSGKAKTGFYDFVQQDYKNAMLRAEKLSSINPKLYGKPVIITIPDSFNNTSKVQSRLDKKPDGTVTQVFDQSLITILFFGESTLYYYQANIDHRNGRIAFDIAGEFHYFDVVHLETQIGYDHVEKPKYITLDLEVGLSDGRLIPFHLRNHRLHADYKIPELLTKTEQQILELFKNRVRKEKSL